MISKIHRFHGQRSLRFVYQNGQTVRGPLFAIKYVLNPKRQSWRLAVVVGKKVHKSAVKRNRMRRRLYAGTRELHRDIIRPYDIVITVFSDELLSVENKQLSKMIKSQLSKSGVLAKKVTSEEKS